MDNYRKILKDDGINKDRTYGIASAMQQLHSVLTKLDEENRKKFFSKPIEQRLSEYAQSESGLRDVTKG